MVLVDNNDPKRKRSYSEPFTAHFYTGYRLPERDRGFVAVGFQPNNYTNAATQSWQYLPGTRRVRKPPEVGFAYPVPPDGFRTVDEHNSFNALPERYTLKRVGKQDNNVQSS